MLQKWHVIHSFADGFGFNNPSENKYIYHRDISHLLKREPEIRCDEDIDKLWEELQPLLDEEAEARRVWLKEHPFKVPEKLRLPNIKNLAPMPDIRKALTESSLKMELFADPKFIGEVTILDQDGQPHEFRWKNNKLEPKDKG